MPEAYENIGVQKIERQEFIETTEELLANIQRPQTRLEDVVGTGKQIITILNNIDSGAVEIVPPLEDDQKKSIRERASTSISIGQKALSILDQTKAQAESSRPKSKKRSKVSGFGSGGKR